MLGEFVLPAGGAAWTTSLVTAADALGIGEKNARQAIARIGEQGLIEPARHGRTVQWSLTSAGRELLETGTERIYTFGTSFVGWDGEWLLAHCPVAEQQRPLRDQLRKRLGFLGFGELSASLLISPHLEREPELRHVLVELGLMPESIVLRSTTASKAESLDLVARAWDLDELSTSYERFTAGYGDDAAGTDGAAFRSVVELVHDWRRFPFIDPELPTELLPPEWAGAVAASCFHERHQAWSKSARGWFASLDADR